MPGRGSSPTVAALSQSIFGRRIAPMLSYVLEHHCEAIRRLARPKGADNLIPAPSSREEPHASPPPFAPGHVTARSLFPVKTKESHKSPRPPWPVPECEGAYTYGKQLGRRKNRMRLRTFLGTCHGFRHGSSPKTVTVRGYYRKTRKATESHNHRMNTVVLVSLCELAYHAVSASMRFGSRMSEVQILSPRPNRACSSRRIDTTTASRP